MKPPKHCNKPAELKFIVDDSGYCDLGAFLWFQCKKCGEVIKIRITDAKSSENVFKK